MAIIYCKGIAGNEVAINTDAIFGVEADGSKPGTHTFVYQRSAPTQADVICLNEPYASVSRKWAAAIGQTQ
jgi:hypothetical protein